MELASLNTKFNSVTESQAEAEMTAELLKDQIEKLTEERDELQASDPSALSQEIYKLQKEVTLLTTDLRDFEKTKEELSKAKNQLHRQTLEVEDINRERDHTTRRV